MNPTALNVLANIKTKLDAEKLDEEFDSLLRELFKSDKDLEKALEKSIDVSTYGALKKDYPEFGKNPEETKKILENLKESLKKLKVLKLYIAFEPSQQIMDRIYAWIKANLWQGIIIEIEKQESILGGAIIEFEGFYKDLSLKKMLDETFQDKRAEILNLLH